MPVIGWGLIGLWVVSWTVWAVWPARYDLVVRVGMETQRVRLRLSTLAVQVIFEGRRGRFPEGEKVPFAGRVRIKILGFLRMERRFPVVGASVRKGGAFLRLRHVWTAWIRSPAPTPVAPKARQGSEGRRARPDDPSTGARVLHERDADHVARLRGVIRRAAIFSRATRPARWLMRRFLRVEQLRLDAAVGTGGAAGTGAMMAIVWWLWGLGSVWLQNTMWLVNAPLLHIQPVFRHGYLRMNVRGRATSRQGWLALMLIVSAWGLAREFVLGRYEIKRSIGQGSRSRRPAAAARVTP